MRIFFLHYVVSLFSIALGVISLREGCKSEDAKGQLLKVNYSPPKNYGKAFFIFLGAVLILGGVSLILMQRK